MKLKTSAKKTTSWWGNLVKGVKSGLKKLGSEAKKVVSKKFNIKFNKKVGGDLKKVKLVLKKGGKDAKAWIKKVSKKLQIKGKKATLKAKAWFAGIQKKL